MADDFTPDRRRAMTPARKRRIWERDGKVCWQCKQPVPMEGPLVRYDHRIPLWISRDDSDVGISPAHLHCDKPKTAKDKGTIGKIKRILKTRTTAPEDRPPSRLQGRGFDKTMTRGFDQKVRPRKPRRTR